MISTILFPSPFLDRKMIDEDMEKEYNAVLQTGLFDTIIFGYEECLQSITNELFHRNAIEILDGDDETDELYDALKELAHNTISEYGWETVFESWKDYMYANCHTVDEALSFAYWFEIYGGNHHKIENPYEFLAYLYDIFDLSPVRYDAQIMDDVSYGLLEAAGIKKNLWSDDSYTTETDPEMIKAVNKIRQERNR